MRFTGFLALAAIALALGGCGSRGDSTSSSSSSATSGSGASGGSVVAAVSKFDGGPRAGEGAIDESRVAAGEKLFTTKGCTACHAFGRKLQCPDLNGVTRRRTAEWMENQILHPEVMVKQDPISHQLFGQYSLQMPNQGLTPDEAKSVIEFLKHKNHEAEVAAKGE
jgi:mono/diheme cytochrome c family protein